MKNASSLAPLTRAWLLLIAVTLISFSNAELLPWRQLAAPVVMLIAGAKVFVILRRFMEVRSAPTGVRLFLTGWTIVCAVGVSALWLAAELNLY